MNPRMNRTLNSLVSIASLLAFLLANGPGGGAVRFLTPTCCTCEDQDSSNNLLCNACGRNCGHEGEECAADADESRFTAHEECSNPLCPVCANQGNLPLCPCPGGCSFCSVAKAPCTACLAPVVTSSNRAESYVAEAALQLPSKHGAKLLRPPRA